MGLAGPVGAPAVEGVAVVDKPAGWTSHDVVAKARALLGTRKVGHAGTLDPDATGVLVLGVGAATRLLTYLSGLDKTYTGEVVLGVATTTLDASGEVTGTWDMAGVDRDAVRAAAAGLTGDIAQVPPMVSAKKVDGRRLHTLARQGVEVERAPVRVRVDRFEVGGAVAPGVWPVIVTCSSGTYVRSLAADLGAALGGGAHLRNLRRTAVGPYRLDEAVALEALTPHGLLPPVEALRGHPRITVDGDVLGFVRHGRVLPRAVLGVPAAPDGGDTPGGGDPPGASDAPDGPWAVIGPDGALVAVYVAHRGDTVKPALVLPSA
ncbi:MAG TPA: tRNA pseudouridine(55) synthase TruB [Acidimicrobiales bacterium]|nr:tRNA pseudouridine(55) synthase TruB [Acidimicrobiales bacterium]